ncbi:MAG: Nif3-like dinuclear metal center hexameric protein [Pseudomonadales bacterium]
MTCTREELLAAANATLDAQSFSDYCPNGLQVEGTKVINKLVAGVTASQALLDEAVTAGADAILVHHGYFWRGENPVLCGLKKRRVATLINNDVNLLAYHLPLDAHPVLGNNAQLAAKLDISVEGVANIEGQALLFHGLNAKPMSGLEFAQHIASRLDRSPLHIESDRAVRKVAWCTGGAQGYIEQAIELGVDAYITGEASEQTTHIAREAGIHFYAAGHHATERYGALALGHFLAEKFKLDFEFIDIDNPV